MKIVLLLLRGLEMDTVMMQQTMQTVTLMVVIVVLFALIQTTVQSVFVIKAILLVSRQVNIILFYIVFFKGSFTLNITRSKLD